MRERHDSHLRAVLSGFAAICVGYAVQLNNGNLEETALELVTLALIAATVTLVLPRFVRVDKPAEHAAVAIAALGIAFAFTRLFTTPPGIYLQLQGGEPYRPYFERLALAAVLCGAALAADDARMKWIVTGLLLGVFLTGGLWLLHTSPRPYIDVFVFQQDSSAALLAGQNPFALTFPDIYGPAAAIFYGPGISVNGQLQFGYPYYPLSLLLALPGYLIAGDYRYAQLFAMAISGGLIAYARPGRLPLLAAALFLYTPRVWFVLEQGWTEPFVVLALAATVFIAGRFPRALPWVLGLFFAVKQYLIFAVPAAWLLLPRPLPPRRELLRFAAKTFGIAAIVTVPFFLWGPGAFINSVVTLQMKQPFRPEALSYLAWFARDGSEHLPTALAFIAAAVALGLGLWRAPRTPGGFALTIAATYTAFFAFNKQAFCNYYYFAVGAFCVAMAAQAPTEPSPSGRGQGEGTPLTP